MLPYFYNSIRPCGSWHCRKILLHHWCFWAPALLTKKASVAVLHNSLRVPFCLRGEFIGPAGPSLSANPASYVAQLTTAMQTLRATTSQKQLRQLLYISDELEHCAQHYDSPFWVIERHNKYFLLDVNRRRKDTTSIDCLKPALDVNGRRKDTTSIGCLKPAYPNILFSCFKTTQHGLAIASLAPMPPVPAASTENVPNHKLHRAPDSPTFHHLGTSTTALSDSFVAGGGVVLVAAVI